MPLRCRRDAAGVFHRRLGGRLRRQPSAPGTPRTRRALPARAARPLPPPRVPVVAARGGAGHLARRRADHAIGSHESALDLLELSNVIPNAIHLTVPRARRGLLAPPGVLLHTTIQPPRRNEATEREGIRLTDSLRTILDAAEWGTAPEQIVLAVRQALVCGWPTEEALR